MHNWVDWLLGFDRGSIEGAEWSIEWRNLPPMWALVLLIVPAIIVFAAIVYRRENKTAPPVARGALSVFRMLLILLLFLVLCEPVLYLEWQNVKEAYVVCLLDDSKSMTLKDKMSDHEAKLKLARVAQVCGPDEQVLNIDQEVALAKLRRADLLNRALANPMFDAKGKDKGKVTALEKLAERYNLRVYTFSDHVQDISGDFSKESMEKARKEGKPLPPGLTATGESTAIGDATAQVLNELNGQPVAAVVVATDGRNTSGQDPVALVRRRMEHNQMPPVYAVGVGNPGEQKSIEVTYLQMPDVALVGDPVDATFRVKQTGYEGEIVHAALMDHDRELVGKDITLGQNNKEQTESVQYKFEKPGDYDVRLFIPPRPDEILDTNHEKKHHIKIVDEKIRVLFVDGYPRWEYRYLKNALIRDKSMVVSCFLQSADLDFPQEGSRGTEPLLRFPTDRKALFDYDVIILGDVDMTTLVDPDKVQETMQNIVAFVDEIGGGVAFCAGFRDDPSSYKNTPLAKLLPVVLEDTATTGVGEDVIQTESFHLKLTPEGKEDPLMKLDPDPQTNERLWEQNDAAALPGLFWFYQVKRAKPGAKVLAEHPTLRTSQGKACPIIAGQQYGRGRTLFVATDETWRWRFIRGDKYFYSFWGEAIRYLRGGKLLGGKRYDVRTDKPAYSLGDQIRIEANVRDEQYNPVGDPTYPATLETPSGVKQEIEMHLKADQKGRYEATLPAAEVGSYQLWVGPDVIGEERERAYATFEVKMPSREFDDPLMDRPSLMTLAAESKGKFLPLYDLDKLPDLVTAPAEVLKPESKEKDLWNSPGVFLLFALLITLEWVLRKKFRLL